MKKFLFKLLSLLVAVQLSLGTPAALSQSAPQTPPQAQAVATQSATRMVLEDGTPVKLRIAQTISSADALVGQTVDFEVLEEVKVGEIVLIPKGGIAWATVTEAQPKRRMGRGGKLSLNIDSVRVVTGAKAALRAVKEVKGGGKGGAMTTGIVVGALLFWPAAPFFLFMKGKDITIPKGTEITTFLNGNFPVDMSQLQEKLMPPQVAPVANPIAAQPLPDTQLEITSTPAGAEIEIDGKFVGNTPSTISVSSGDHVITIKKSGFKPFEKKLMTTTGKITISAALESETTP